MVVEIAVGTAVSWLWSKLADTAKAKDNEIAIKKALQDSIDKSFRRFQIKYGDSSELFFNQEFLENHVCKEILKYLTRDQQPDLDSVSNALPVNALFVSESGFREEIKEFFDTIFNCMKSQAILQNIINYRQIEETNQIAKDIQEKQSSTSKLLEEKFDEIAFEQNKSSSNINNLTTQSADQHADLINTLAGMQSQLADSLPGNKGNELNKFLTKQLDRARDLINAGQVDDAKALLESMADEVRESDDYTRFRWHTNLGACFLSHDKRQEAAEQYLVAFNFAKDEEKAIANRVRAFLLKNQFDEGLKESEKALEVYPDSGIIWALHINVNNLLNNEFELSLLPTDLQHDTSVLLSLSDLKFRKKEFEDSYALTRDAFQQDNNSNDVKRAMLASVLSWITQDTVKSHYKQLTTEQLDSLQATVDSFGDIISYLKSIQSKHVFTEVAHNLAVAVEMLGEHQLKNKITTYAFSEYPDEEAFLWYRVKELKESGDIDAIHRLTDDKINTLEKALLFTIAEIGANTGDTQWVESIAQVINSKDLDKHDEDELFGLELCSMWKGGDKTSAIKLAKDNISRITSYPSLLSFYIRLLDEHGETSERDKLLESCKSLPEDASSIDIIQIADLLYDFNFHYDASALYQKLIESPTDDYLTKRYLDSLIKSGQRAKALVELERLPIEVRKSSSFKRIEANLARASGDLDTLERILKEELDADPLDSFVATGYIATLYRKNKLEPLSEYLRENPTFNPIIKQNEIEIAKYQMELGLENQALLRMYSLFRSNPGSSEIAGYFLLLMLLAKNFDQLKGLSEVSACTVIYLASDGENKNIIIEPISLEGDSGWPECISEASELANNIIEKKVGDVVSVDSGIGSKQWNIVGIDSMFIFASNIAHKVVASSASSAGPLWSVNVIKSDGDFDFSPILESLKQRRQHVEHVFSIYEEKKLPFQMLSKALGTDIVTLLLEWPYKKYDMLVSTGVHEEREKIKNEITTGDKSYVVDLSCLIELHVLGFLQESLQVLGKPFVAVSLREQLLSIIQVHNKMEPSGIASEVDGQLRYDEIPPSHLEERGRFLNELLKFIDEHCEVVPVVGPDIVTEQEVALEQYIGLASNDTILLTRERNAILVSEDGALRGVAVGMGVTSSSWLQPILMILRDRKVISEEQYSKSILDKLNRRHDFTSVETMDLLWAAKSCPDSIAPEVESAIQTFRNSTLDLASGVIVGAQFLKFVAEHIQPNTLYKYYKIIFEALSFEREVYADNIHNSLIANIESALSSLERKKVKAINRKFGRELLPKKVKMQQPRLKPVVQAIKIALRDRKF
ncbi:MAG: tetratricopeptide repeat protein [Pseudomonadota bacterium]